MFNKNYFSYLYKSKASAWIGLAGIITAFSTSPYFYIYNEEKDVLFKNSLNIASICILVLTFVLPLFLFSFVHRKRSCDQTFSLPIKRSELLITTITFMSCICIGSYVCSSLFSYIVSSFSSKISFVMYIESLMNITFSTIVLLTINTLFYMFANNIIDGIIIMAAYTCIPMAVVATLWLIGNKLLMSTVLQPYTIATYLSPVAMVYTNQWSIYYEQNAFSWIYIILLTVFFILALVDLRRHFINRKTERAEQISNNFEAYPFIINAYLACSLIYLAFGILKGGISGLNIILYVFLFMIYMVALVIYKRKIKFYSKNIVYFVVLALVAVGFSRLCFYTKAFGLAYSVSNTHHTAKYEYRAYDVKKDLSDVNLNVISCDDGDCYYRQSSDPMISVYGEFLVNEEERNDSTYSKAIEILDNHKKYCVDFYFQSIGGYNFAKSYLDLSISTNTFNYDSDTIFTIEELKELEKLGTVEVTEYDAETGNETTYSLEEYLKEVN